MNLSFGNINIMIGGNGAGKSNFISYFKFLNQIISRNLQAYVARNGGANNLLFFGSKISPEMGFKITFNNQSSRLKNVYTSYEARLAPNTTDGFYFTSESIGYQEGLGGNNNERFLGVGHSESKLEEYNRTDSNFYGGANGVSFYAIKACKGLKVYHFHDTSDSAKVKNTGDLEDNQFLREDASNLAAFLYRLKERHIENYRQIETTIRRIAPFFHGFDLKPSALNPDKIRLEWSEKGSDLYFNAHSLSDGTLRMMCLATLLLQPELPETIIIDEPELGLHPSAIHLLASLIKMASERTQLIISTQSVTLINQFTPQDIIVVDRSEGQSVFRRIDENELTLWQDDYALGEIWEKNLIGGRP